MKETTPEDMHPAGCDCAAHGSGASVSLVGTPKQVVFRVRERSAVIRYFGDTAVKVRGGVFPAGRVRVVAVLLRVGQYVTKEYATWWDFRQTGSPPLFEAMSSEEYLSFHFFGDNDRLERTFISANPLKDFFAGAIGDLTAAPSWTKEEFGAAQLKVLSELHGKSLWEAVAAERGA